MVIKVNDNELKRSDDLTIINSLKHIDALCGKDVLDFVMSLYDSESGGFYYATSSKLNKQFGTNLESTAQALSFLEIGKVQGINGRLQDVIPECVQNKFISYVQGCQSDKNGYFYNAWQGTDVYQEKRERDLRYALLILERFGGKPLYKLPSERLGREAAVSSENAYLQSEETFIRWLDERNWEDTYSTGHLIGSSQNIIKAAGYEMIAAEYIAKKQNTETGLWGEGLTYAAINGTMKLSYFFRAGTIPLPNFDKMTKSIIAVLKGPETPPTICSVWNPLVAIVKGMESYSGNVSPSIKDYIKGALGDVIDITYKNMRLFKQADGGISYFKEHGQASTHGSPIGLGLAEGDIDATLIGTLKIRRALYNLAGYSFIPPIYEKYADEVRHKFLKILGMDAVLYHL